MILLIILPSGCKKQELNTDKNNGTDTLQLVESGERPYDKEAEELAAKYHQKSAIALAQLQRGIDFAKANGIEKLIEILKNPKDPQWGKFVSGDYYIWIIRSDFKSNAIVDVHPINKAINGRDFFGIKDAEGKMFIKDILRILSYKEAGWVSYKWTHPKYKKVMDKMTCSQRFNDYVLNDGFYLKD